MSQAFLSATWQYGQCSIQFTISSVAFVVIRISHIHACQAAVTLNQQSITSRVDMVEVSVLVAEFVAVCLLLIDDLYKPH